MPELLFFFKKGKQNRIYTLKKKNKTGHLLIILFCCHLIISFNFPFPYPELSKKKIQI